MLLIARAHPKKSFNRCATAAIVNNAAAILVYVFIFIAGSNKDYSDKNIFFDY